MGKEAAWGPAPPPPPYVLGSGLEGRNTGLSQVGQEAVTSARAEMVG